MSELSGLIAQSQQLLSDARGGKRIGGYHERCRAWAQRVENAFRDDPAALSRFRMPVGMCRTLPTVITELTLKLSRCAVQS